MFSWAHSESILKIVHGKTASCIECNELAESILKNMEKRKKLKININDINKKCAIHCNVALIWTWFHIQYSTEVYLCYTYLLPTFLYNNSSPKLYPTAMLLACSMLKVGLLTCMCTVWTECQLYLYTFLLVLCLVIHSKNQCTIHLYTIHLSHAPSQAPSSQNQCTFHL